MCLLKQRQLSSSSTVSVVITKKFCWHTPVQYWMSHYKWDMALCCKPGHPTQFKPAWVPPNAWKKLSCTYRPCFLWLWLTARSSCTNRLGSDLRGWHAHIDTNIFSKAACSTRVDKFEEISRFSYDCDQ